MVSQEFLAMAYDAPVVKWAPVNGSVRIASAVALVACASAAVLAQRDQPAAAGAALFERSCASCHNVEGRARLPAEGRDVICFEPMTGITDALNLAQRGLHRDVQYIAPGGFWKETFWIRPGGF